MRHATRRGLLGLLLWVGVVPAATAEPVMLTSGFLAMDPREGPIELHGTAGFSFSGFVNWTGGSFDPFTQCAFATCEAGEPISLHAGWGGLDLPGTATFGGQTFEAVGGLNSNSGMVVSFDGTATLPARTGAEATLLAPFTVSGLFGHDFDVELLTGSGTATLRLRADPLVSNAWLLDSARYDIGAPAPIPEPTTVLLVGGGIAAAVLRRRRRTANRSRA
jgi:hypothetical protein